MSGSVMRSVMKVAGMALAAALATGPALAQQSGTTAPATHALGKAAHPVNKPPSDRNPILTDGGDARASRIIGSSVYNEHNDKIGTVDDVLIGKHGKLRVVLAIGGFLGAGERYVSLPYERLRFGDTNAGSDNRVVLPGATTKSLKSMPAYHYTKAFGHG